MVAYGQGRQRVDEDICMEKGALTRLSQHALGEVGCDLAAKVVGIGEMIAGQGQRAQGADGSEQSHRTAMP